jgi:hypothetical protein
MPLTARNPRGTWPTTCFTVGETRSGIWELWNEPRERHSGSRLAVYVQSLRKLNVGSSVRDRTRGGASWRRGLEPTVPGPGVLWE